MAQFSNHIPYNSPDGLPSNPYPLVPIPVTCKECFNKTEKEICEHCGAENEIDYESDTEPEYDDD